MIKVLQLALELLFGFVVATCAIPTEDRGKDMAIEPIRFVCVAEINDSGKYMIAGQAWKVSDDEGDIIAGEWQ